MVEGPECKALNLALGAPLAKPSFFSNTPPLQLQQSLPLQHHTMVYSMQPNPPLTLGNREHGRAITEQT